MRDNEYKDGMYCSRKYAQWMLRKNEQDTDFPATTYYKLVRLFSKTNYNEFFSEEERKGNNFYYNIRKEGDKIWLERSYDLVFLPYEATIKEDPNRTYDHVELQSVEEFVPGYRILQTRGYMPGSTWATFNSQDYFSMWALIEELIQRADRWEKFAKSKHIDIDDLIEQGKGYDLGYNWRAYHNKCDDIYRAEEFQEAEMKDFIDNEMPFSFGPQCPDKIICYQMFTQVTNRLIKEVDRLKLVDKKQSKFYELRVVAYVAAIISAVIPDDYVLSKGLETDAIKEKAEDLFQNYCVSSKQELGEICRKIRIGLLWEVNVIIDRSSISHCDYDYTDSMEAPIGLTNEDREVFERLSSSSSFEEDLVEIDEDEEFDDLFDFDDEE